MSGWRGSAGQVRRRQLSPTGQLDFFFTVVPPQDNWKLFFKVVGLDDNLDIFFAGIHLGAGLAGLRCRAGGAAGNRHQPFFGCCPRGVPQTAPRERAGNPCPALKLFASPASAVARAKYSVGRASTKGTVGRASTHWANQLGEPVGRASTKGPTCTREFELKDIILQFLVYFQYDTNVLRTRTCR